MNVSAQVKTTDSTFINNSRPIVFVVNRTDISESDKDWINNFLIPELEALGDRDIILGRATASPEGSTPNNVRLARSRKASMDALLGRYGINTKRIRYDVVPEDYPLLLSLMQMEHDKYLPIVKTIIRKHDGKGDRLKAELKRLEGGKIWNHLLKKYFPQLRAVRIMPIDERLVDTNRLPEAKPIHTDLPFPKPNIYVEMPLPEPAESSKKRRELLSIKTNLLYDFAYMPGYDRFCPIPNVALEYYPLSGHFTYGASFEGPWWRNYKEHKYFQLRNYQLHTRYYLQSGETGFRGFFVSAYAHAFLYNICFDENGDGKVKDGEPDWDWVGRYRWTAPNTGDSTSVCRQDFSIPAMTHTSGSALWMEIKTNRYIITNGMEMPRISKSDSIAILG